LTAHDPITNTELTVNSAEDSTSMVATDLYNPSILGEDPMPARTFLLYRTSRMTIMEVRITLRASESEIYTV